MTAPEACLSHLECARCRTRADADRPASVCECGGLWLARYDMDRARASLERGSARPRGIWRWAEMLPVRDPSRRRGLGEGDTPLLEAPRLAVELGIPGLLLKDEGRNPGGSFKARGMAVAVARAVELGARRFALPSAGNAGGAAAAYGALWEAEVRVALPASTPEPFRREIRGHGASILDVPGDIAAAGRELARHPDAGRWWFLNTLREPYRLEGKKTLGYELVEQLGGTWPDVVVYPTGGGTGLLGMVKADAELRVLGRCGGAPPRWVVVQAEGCAPLVQAFHQGRTEAEPWPEPRTQAHGLRVPGTLGDHLILEALRAAGGTAVAVTEAEIREERRRTARLEGLHTAPESAATVAASRRLREAGWIRSGERVVLFFTGDGFKYPVDPADAGRDEGGGPGGPGA